ncbi:hypothetical protein AAFF_G00245190 [Aldrovandia affinis]|uniref:Uncharacterized protein n=1 Tax=Aldrovandia affinis TaxID=143900 RepID=A0AAD7W3L1_9TELE|nr:hypothetical protein AAFF_G00245190 [Aldrovandia affinis]
MEGTIEIQLADRAPWKRDALERTQQHCWAVCVPTPARKQMAWPPQSRDRLECGAAAISPLNTATAELKTKTAVRGLAGTLDSDAIQSLSTLSVAPVMYARAVACFSKPRQPPSGENTGLAACHQRHWGRSPTSKCIETWRRYPLRHSCEQKC